MLVSSEGVDSLLEDVSACASLKQNEKDVHISKKEYKRLAWIVRKEGDTFLEEKSFTIDIKGIMR